jgi:hypothetical protein
MKSVWVYGCVGAGALWAVCGAAIAAPAKKPAAKAVVRKPALTVAQVMERYIQASGGKDIYDRIKSYTMNGTLKAEAQGISGTFSIQAKAPDKMLSTQTIAGVGDTKQGYDGKVGWSQDPLNGVRTLSGPELAAVKRGAQFNSSLRWREVYPKQEMLGYRKVGSGEAYAIRLTPAEGQPTVNYYDTKTFLLVRSDTNTDGPQGTMPVETHLSDFRSVDGMKMPFKMRQRAGGVLEIVMAVAELKTNVPLEDSLFAKPAAPPKTK